jgi:hypothetical protein
VGGYGGDRAQQPGNITNLEEFGDGVGVSHLGQVEGVRHGDSRREVVGDEVLQAGELVVEGEAQQLGTHLPHLLRPHVTAVEVPQHGSDLKRRVD